MASGEQRLTLVKVNYEAGVREGNVWWGSSRRFCGKGIKDMPNLCVTAGNKKGQESVTAMIGGIMGYRGRAEGPAAVPADSLTLLDPSERIKLSS